MNLITIALEGDDAHPVLRSIEVGDKTVEVRGAERLKNSIVQMSDDDFVQFIIDAIRAKARSLEG